MASFLTPPSALQVPRINELTWVVQPICILADYSQAYGYGRAGWAASVVTSCSALLKPRKLEEYAPGLATWRAENWPRMLMITLFLAAVVIPLARRCLEPVFKSLGRRALTRSSPDGAPRRPLEDGLRLQKWKEASWKLVCYTCLLAVGLCVCPGEPWMKDTSLFWRGWPSQHAHPLRLQLFYCAETAHYLYGVLDLLVWESRRKDHVAMVVHHVATISLLCISFHWSFLRVGCLIMLLHDACDVWMEAAKLAKYAAVEWLATVLFVVFAVSWLLLRMVFFPFVVIRSTGVEAMVLLERFGASTPNALMWGGFNVLLLVLLVLHTYWFYFILLIAIRVLMASEISDSRSDDEMEEEERTGKKSSAGRRKGVKAAAPKGAGAAAKKRE